MVSVVESEVRDLVPLKTHYVEGMTHIKTVLFKVLTFTWYGSSENGCQIGCQPHLLSEAQNYVVVANRTRFGSEGGLI
ncbi:hypothetical protein TNCV_2561511 [Trichonephila clavipes]|uniref:Uncharacterized protein n=1 Tax=Trichonephila clavipes TaxID=2585209 RepID=A0A8X6R550_TRICX|nr:hypothetical protein TNCV_2561511 [Trichonephila clavipes]